jgi:hypothetical protein
MPSSVFVITLGDVIGIGLFVLCVLGVAGYALFATIREKLCKHDFHPARISRSGSFYIDGFRCRKCGQERKRIEDDERRPDAG